MAMLLAETTGLFADVFCAAGRFTLPRSAGQVKERQRFRTAREWASSTPVQPGRMPIKSLHIGQVTQWLDLNFGQGMLSMQLSPQLRQCSPNAMVEMTPSRQGPEGMTRSAKRAAPLCGGRYGHASALVRSADSSAMGAVGRRVGLGCPESCPVLPPFACGACILVPQSGGGQIVYPMSTNAVWLVPNRRKNEQA